MPQTRQHICGMRSVRQCRPTDGILVTEKEIQKFLAAYGNMNRRDATVQFYRQKLERFYKDLPADKTIGHGTLQKWQESLLRCGYTPRTVNAFLSAANAYLDYVGHREYQLAGQLKEENPPQPELSRTEYLHLLRAAKALGKEKAYLLIKLFASTGLFAQELSAVTVAAVETGKIICVQNKCKKIVTIPSCLRNELLSYAQKSRIITGPIFQTRDGRPLHRTYVSATIRSICEEARVPSEKGNPKCLRKLYLTTKAEVESNVAQIVEQAVWCILDQ